MIDREELREKVREELFRQWLGEFDPDTSGGVDAVMAIVEPLLRWTPCSEAMPTEAGKYECINRIGDNYRELVAGEWDATLGFHEHSEMGTTYCFRRVTHWRPWSGWPGEEGK